MFKVRERYTRDEIHNQVGGSKQSYLPSKNKIVTCVCLTKDLNPCAPNVILSGSGKIIEQAAQWLVEQQNILPVFIKESPNNWIFRGMFRVSRYVTDKDEMRFKYNLASRTDVHMVIEMQECDS